MTTKKYDCSKYPTENLFYDYETLKDEELSILYPSRNKRRRDLWTVMGVRYNPA